MKIKVCGLTRIDDARACVAAGVDWLGLNFHPGSPRRVNLVAARAIRRAVDDRAQIVGLFVDRPPSEIIEVSRAIGIDLVQLHGDEPVEWLAELAGLRVVKAFRLEGPDSVGWVQAYIAGAERAGTPLHAILVDAHVPGQFGGTGVAIGGDLLASLPDHPRLILAGGLTPENVADRLTLARPRPWMVDVASGVESSPGRKCPERVARFVAEARLGSATRR